MKITIIALTPTGRTKSYTKIAAMEDLIILMKANIGMGLLFKIMRLH